MTPGAAAAIAIAIRTFVDPGDDVIGVAPYFPEFRLYCETASARFVPVADGAGPASRSRRHQRCAVRHIPQRCSSTRPAIRAATCSTAGSCPGSRPLLEAHNNKHDRKVLLIIDEVYRRLTYPPHQRVEPFHIYEHTVLARSFSKDLGVAGERIGYLVLHPSLVNADTHRGLAQALRALGFVNAPATAQRALLHLELVGDQRRAVSRTSRHGHGPGAGGRPRRLSNRRAASISGCAARGPTRSGSSTR